MCSIIWALSCKLVFYVSYSRGNKGLCLITSSFVGEWKGAKKGTTQGSVSGPFLFNVFLNGLDIQLDSGIKGSVVRGTLHSTM